MDLEASITERLQKLKQWQIEQQEKLLKQQQMQRENLSQEKNRIYRVLGLPLQNLNLQDLQNMEDKNIEYGTEIDLKETMSLYDIKNTDSILEIEEKTKNVSCNNLKEEHIKKNLGRDHSPVILEKNSMRNPGRKREFSMEELNGDVLMEGIKPLVSDEAANILINRNISIDDIPICSPKKDFQTLLEEKLRKESEFVSNAHTDARIKPKRPFLRKGEGLSRYKMSVNSRAPLKTARRNSMPPSLNAQRVNKTEKHRTSISQKNVFSNIASGARRLSLKNVPLPRNKISKSESNTPTGQLACSTNFSRLKCPPEINTSDIDLKAVRELEEVRIFELMEEKAENSSFCSTSSTVLAFLQQSTPFKVRKSLNYVGSDCDIAPRTRQQNKKGKNDVIERAVHVGHSKQSEVRKPRTNTATTVDSHCDTVTANDTLKGTQKHTHMTVSTQVSQNEKTHRNRDVSCKTLSDSEEEEREEKEEEEEEKEEEEEEKEEEEGEEEEEEERKEEEEEEIFAEDNLEHNGEANTNHRVRFSKYNEYRTIDLTDMSDTMNKSPLIDYLEQQKLDDRSDNTESSTESSSVEQELPLSCSEEVSLRETFDDEEQIDALRRLSLQQGVTKDLYYHVLKVLDNNKNKTASNCKNKSPDKDTSNDNKCEIEEIAQTSDEEQSVLSASSTSSSSSSSSRRRLSKHKEKNHVLKRSEKITKQIMELCSNMDESECHQDEIKTNEVNVFEPELLKTRLLELQNEIDIFRKESAALLLQRRRLQEDQTSLHKQYVMKEKKFEETRRRVQNQLEEEKKRLTREKIAMENRIRDAQEKAKQNKMERQKAQILQEQLEQVRDELNVKESRWNAAESRYKSELRVLRVEISKLKQEIANLQNTKRTNVKNIKKNASKQTITRAISQINKRITAMPSKETLAKMPRDLSSTSSDASVRDDNNDDNGDGNKPIEPITKIIDVNDDFEQMESDVPINKIETKQKSEPKTNLKVVKPAEAKKKQDLYAALLKDAISDLVDNGSQSHVKNDADDVRQPMLVAQRSSPKHNRTSEKSNEKSCFFANDDPEHTAHTAEYFADRSRKVHQDHDKTDTTTQDEISSSKEKNSSPASHRSSIDHQIGAKDDVKEIHYFEYCYPNGNVKKIFPDQGVSKMIYYNGDVRETDKDGKVKYFYATSRTWHTTTPDGVEILEFPSGQVEKRTPDGTVEASFPDGFVRIAHADGTQKWSLPDGTTAETFSNGDKILTFPNGQREIHTKSHKRREYPDGTVKIIYADGTQETRYSSGRKRLKDREGNLLMDSYD